MTGSNFCNSDVVLVLFPFTDLSASKQRPALIISSTKFNRVFRDVIIVAITSHIEPRVLEHTEYRLNKTENSAAGLPKPSVIKLAKIATIDQSLIRKILGQLPRPSMKHVVSKISQLFG